jgi:hypothetical protein
MSRHEHGELTEVVDARFSAVDSWLTRINARFDQMDRRFDALETRLAAEREATRRHMESSWSNSRPNIDAA